MRTGVSGCGFDTKKRIKMHRQIFQVLLSLALFKGAFSSPIVNASLLNYDQSFAQHELDLCEAAYCANNTAEWFCVTCDPGIDLTAVIDSNGARALVGYDSTYDALFVAYRGSENIQNWIDNVKFFHTAPYPDMPDVEVELGFYEWYTDLKTQVDAALETLKTTYSTSLIKITGHSAGGAVATLHAFDIARNESSTPGLKLQSVVTFGSPRVGNTEFVQAHNQYINQDVIPAWRVTHYYDMVPHLPQESLGYSHVSTEVWYNEPSTSYTVCDGSGEDPNCSNSCAPLHCTSVSDHLDYINTPMGSGGC